MPRTACSTSNSGWRARRERTFSRFVTADEAGKTHEGLLLFLLAGDAHLLGIDHDHEIAGIDVWSEDRFFFAAEQVGGLDRDPAKDLVLGVDDPPFAVDLDLLLRKTSSSENWGRAGKVAAASKGVNPWHFECFFEVDALGRVRP